MQKNLHIANSTPNGLSESCASSAKSSTDSTQTQESTTKGQTENKDSVSYSVSLINGSESLTSKVGKVSVENVMTVMDDTISLGGKNSGVSVTKPENPQKPIIKESKDRVVQADENTVCTESSNLQQQGALFEQSEQGSLCPVSEGDSGIDPYAEGGEEDSGPGVTDGAVGGSLTAEGLANSNAKTEQQDKKKGEVFLPFSVRCTL